MKTIYYITNVTLLTVALCGSVAAQSYAIPWFSLDGGGGTCAGSRFTLSGTIGQSDTGTASGGRYTLIGGFWGSPSGGGNSQTDADRDGIPDEWERTYGLNPTDRNDATADRDADGKTNWEEYIANTNPLDSRSNLVMSTGVGNPGGQPSSIIVSWIGIHDVGIGSP